MVIATDTSHPEASDRWNFSPTFSYRVQNVDGILSMSMDIPKEQKYFSQSSKGIWTGKIL